MRSLAGGIEPHPRGKAERGDQKLAPPECSGSGIVTVQTSALIGLKPASLLYRRNEAADIGGLDAAICV
jgi:hypothetical protein